MRRSTMLGGILLLLGLSWVPQGARAQSSAGSDADLTILAKAARAEGEFVLYAAPSDAVTKRILDGYSAKYGIKTRFLRLATTTLAERFEAEAASGATAADALLNAGDVLSFAQSGVAKGWIESITDARLPVVTSGRFPAKFNRGATALVQILPAYLAYNTDKVKAADIPKDWSDLLKPAFTDEILISSPLAADFNLEIFVKLRDKYGDDFLKKLAAQIHRRFDSGIPAMQALSAGEGKVMFPISYPGIQTMIAKGAPVAGALFDFTTGAEMQVVLVSPKLAKHPNAARLFANYVMSEEGNAVVNADPGGFTIYEDSKLPGQFRPPSAESAQYKDQIAKILGYK